MTEMEPIRESGKQVLGSGTNFQFEKTRPLAEHASAEACLGLARKPNPACLPNFRTIYKQYFSFVRSNARSLGATTEVIDDVVQEVFMVVHAKLSTLQRPESLGSWIYGILRRTLSGYRRARRIRDTAEARLSVEIKGNHPAPASPLEHAEWNAELQRLQRVLLALDPPHREIFILAEILELTAPEAAQLLAIPLNTVYSRLRRARLRFDEALAWYEARGKPRYSTR